jgi:hypothetical protein
MRAISPGISLPATEMTPWPPTDITGSVIASSPETTRNSAGRLRRTSQICAMFPEASLTPMMLGMSASRTSVAVSTFEPVRPATL